MNGSAGEQHGDQQVAAILLAAGYGTRLGKPKALLKHDGEYAVTRVCANLMAAGCSPIVTVLNADVHAEVIANSDSFGGLQHDRSIIVNPSPELGTLHSIRLGLEAISSQVDAVMLMAVDHPFVLVETLQQLRNAADKAHIVVSVYNEKRGHPPVFGADHLQTLFDIPLDEGARGVIRRTPESVVEVTVDDEAVLWNVNTADDWERYSVMKR